MIDFSSIFKLKQLLNIFFYNPELCWGLKLKKYNHELLSPSGVSSSFGMDSLIFKSTFACLTPKTDKIP